VELRTGTPGWPEPDYDTGELYARLTLDRLDNYNFPGEGSLALIDYSMARDQLGGDSDFDQMRLGGNFFTTFGSGHVVGLTGQVATTLNGEAAVQDRYRLGGFMNLSGFPEDALSGQQAAVISAVYYRRFEPLPFLSWYIGASLEYGGVWENKSDIGTDGIAAGSFFLGADTPIGPAYLGFGHAEGGHNALFFYLGRPAFRIE
jgi:NTE family protein